MKCHFADVFYVGVILAVIAFTGCSKEQPESFPSKPASELGVDDFAGRREGVSVGTVTAKYLLERQPEAIEVSFNSISAGIEALKLGKVDAYATDDIILRSWAAHSCGQLATTPCFTHIPVGLAFRKGSPLKAVFDPVIEGMLQSGELKRIIDKWADAPDLDTVREEDIESRFPSFTGKAGKVTVFMSC